MISSRDVKIPVILRGEDKDALVSSGAFNSTISGAPFTDNDDLPQDAATEAYTGRCCLFDLSKEEDRAKYADIKAQMAIGNDLFPGWEDRVQAEGKVVIYMFYLEKVYISSKTKKEIGKNDK